MKKRAFLSAVLSGYAILKIRDKVIVAFFLMLLVCFSKGQEIRFPTEELARESVFPVFEDNNQATMNRKVSLKYKLDLFGSAFLRGDEPFYFRLLVSSGLGFYLSEKYGLSLTGFYFMPGRSANGKNLLSVESKAEGYIPNRFDTTLAPHPQWAVFLNYVVSPFYGKISLSKKMVTNFNVSLSAGVGLIHLAQNECSLCESVSLTGVMWRPAVWLGIKQRIFLGKRFYFYSSFGFLTYYGPNPVNINIREASQPPPLADFTDPYVFYFGHDAREVFIFRNAVGGGLGMFFF